MPADRLFHPRIGDSEKVARLTDMEFRVWMTYILAADDFGVLPMTAAKIQGADRTLGNRKKAQVDRALETLADIGLVRSFEHQGARFIYTAGWQSHQRIRYPRRSHYPAPPRADVERCDRETRGFFLKFHHNFSEVLPESSGKETETVQTPASAGGRETLTANGNGVRLTANGRERVLVDETPPMDRWLERLREDYPQQSVTAGHLTERAFFDALSNDPRGPKAAFEVMLSNLENQKRGHQWRMKRMIPRLDKWLREGLWQQQHDENPPVAERLTKNTNTTLAAAAEALKS